MSFDIFFLMNSGCHIDKNTSGVNDIYFVANIMENEMADVIFCPIYSNYKLKVLT